MSCESCGAWRPTACATPKPRCSPSTDSAKAFAGRWCRALEGAGAFEAVVYDELKVLGREDEYARVIGRTQAARFSGVMAASLGAAVVSPLGYPTLIWASTWHVILYQLASPVPVLTSVWMRFVAAA